MKPVNFVQKHSKQYHGNSFDHYFRYFTCAVKQTAAALLSARVEAELCVCVDRRRLFWRTSTSAKHNSTWTGISWEL